MIELNGRKVLIGGFHDHWHRADPNNATLLMAALNYFHYDFITMQDDPQYLPPVADAARAVSDCIRIYPGREEGFAWGHVVTVAPREEPIRGDLAMGCCDDVLAQLKSTCDLVILAHPEYPGTWERIFLTGEIDRLLDEGLIDGVNLINGSGAFRDKKHRNYEKLVKMIAWMEARQASGKVVPIVNGWDVHLLTPVRNLPPVLYGPKRSPIGHLDSCGFHRTILLVEDNSYEGIIKAVKAGQTAIQDIATGDIIGTPDVVEFLRGAGLNDKLAEMDRIRDELTPEVSGPWTVGQPARITVSAAGTLKIPRSATEFDSVTVAAGETVSIGPLESWNQREKDYLPFAFSDGGSERICAVEVRHCIQFRILPKLDCPEPAVEIVPKTPFEGTATIEVEGLLDRTEVSLDGGACVVPIQPDKITDLPANYKMIARNSDGLECPFAGHLTYLPAPRFTGDWSIVPSFGIDKPCFVSTEAYGQKRPWPGPDVFSGRIQFAWSDEALHFRADVTDAIHYQASSKGMLCNGDSIQLAIDPMMLQEGDLGSAYIYNMALTDDGPEVFRFWSPMIETGLSFTPPPARVSLGGKYMSVEKTDRGLLYELTLPWSQLAPAQGRPQRMGVYFLMFNNDGQGVLDTLFWPRPIEGMWMTPNLWGVLSLMS